MHALLSRAATAARAARPAVHTVTEALSDLAGWALIIVGTTWALGVFGVGLARAIAPNWLALTVTAAVMVVWLVAELTRPTVDDDTDA